VSEGAEHAAGDVEHAEHRVERAHYVAIAPRLLGLGERDRYQLLPLARARVLDGAPPIFGRCGLERDEPGRHEDQSLRGQEDALGQAVIALHLCDRGDRAHRALERLDVKLPGVRIERRDRSEEQDPDQHWSRSIGLLLGYGKWIDC
jgi:hypothetical protein